MCGRADGVFQREPRSLAVRSRRTARRRERRTNRRRRASLAMFQRARLLLRNAAPAARSSRAGSWDDRDRIRLAAALRRAPARDRHDRCGRRRPRLSVDRLARAVPRPLRTVARDPRSAGGRQSRHRRVGRHSLSAAPARAAHEAAPGGGVRRAVGKEIGSVRDGHRRRRYGGRVRALGIPRVDLYGDSYGTFFAQAFAGRHPRSVRTVVLDGAYRWTGCKPVVSERQPADARRLRPGLLAVL